MKHLPSLLWLSLLLAVCWQCQNPNSESDGTQSTSQFEQLAVRWELISNQISDRPEFRSAFTIQNNSQQTLGAEGWQLYFNMSPRRIRENSTKGPAVVEQINGDFYRLVPNSDFSLQPGQEVKVTFDAAAWFIKEADAPAGLYFANGSQVLNSVKEYTLMPMERPEQVQRHKNDPVPLPTAATRYKENQRLRPLSPDQITAIIPTPLSIQKNGKDLKIDASFQIVCEEAHTEKAKQLQAGLQSSMGVELPIVAGTSAGPKSILLKVGQVSAGVNGQEDYELSIDTDSGIQIIGGDIAGMFYGIQSLLALLPPESFAQPQSSLSLPGVQIVDAPRFSYRGLHIDLARNFNSKASILKAIDLLAAYKLNKLHLHLTEDEAWRLEIRGFPELTQVGSRRGHTLDDKDFLQPSYGSGPDPDNPNSSGNGYYTRADYIEILRHATSKHIEVITEINMPGHARAAIRAMEARYRRLSQAGQTEAAEKFRLIDPDDQSVYLSAQHYNDNIVCVCKEAIYDFYAAVLDDVISIYKEANAPLKVLHTGGDEVPNGAWDGSPLCQKLRAEKPELASKEALQAYFLGRINKLLEERGLVTGGWEEIVLSKDENGRFIPIESFADKNVLPYIWNNFWGNEDLAYRIANQGFDVVLCNVSNLYFDLAYDKDPTEPGLYWGGLIDTRKAYEMDPFDIFKTLKEDPMGNPYKAEDFKNMERLKVSAYKNVVGLQGQLWSETIKGPEMLEYYMFPKLLGLAERAWAKTPEWMSNVNEKRRQTALTEDWNGFAHTVGKRETVRMDHRFGGVAYRLPPPGAILKEGLLNANVAFPGLTIRYSTSGEAPTADSPAYEGPVAVEGKVLLATFDSRGRSSRVVEARDMLED